MIKTYGFEEKALANPASSSSLLGLRLSEAFKFPEHSDRKLAVKSTGGTELVEDEDFLFRGSFLITEKDRLDVFFFRLRTHNLISFPLRYPVTSIMSQRSLFIQTLGSI